MQKWEYKIFKQWPMQESVLNQLGDEGWELILFDHDNAYFIFKRPKP